MFETELKLFAFMQAYGLKLIEDIDPNEMVQRPIENGTSGSWLLGHLSVVYDRVGSMMTGQTFLDESWHEHFKPGSPVLSDANVYPKKDELVQAYTEGHTRLEEALGKATPDTLNGPNPIEWLVPYLPTAADLIAHILTTHEATHLGQFSMWRRALGKPSAL